MNFEGADRGKQLKAIADYIEPVIRRALDEATRSCLNCEHFSPGPPDRSQEKCSLNWLTPPPSIAARGCDNHMDKVPF